MKPTKTLAISAIALSFGLAVGSVKAQAIDDTWEISAGYFAPKVSTSIGVSGTANDGITSTSGQESVRLNDDFHGAKVEGIWRFKDRQRLTAGWYGINSTKRFDVQESGNVNDPDLGNINYTLDGKAKWKTDFDLYHVNYGYDLLQSDNFALTGQVGVYGARLNTRLQTEGIATVDDGTETTVEPLDYNFRYRTTKYAPGVGLTAEWAPRDRWEVRAGVQGFRTQWGNFDTRGHFYNAQAEVGYQFTPQWTGFAGYDWFDLKLKDQESTTITADNTTYDVAGTVTGRIKVHGPVVGVRARF